jgi:hypothetical protein
MTEPREKQLSRKATYMMEQMQLMRSWHEALADEARINLTRGSLAIVERSTAKATYNRHTMQAERLDRAIGELAAYIETIQENR